MKLINNSKLLYHHGMSANEIRQIFLNYFISKGHSFIRSSPVKPFGDPTLEFVNAGMNQFKNVFMGLSEPPAARATNSQKCIRVGGKHNDLDAVGHDSYHHTFFEMLGSWSFRNYFKEDACKYALELVTSPPYSLALNQLYVTYFKGDNCLKIPPDLEVKSIWKGLGIPEERILPFGLKENFWEMGLCGPCGPCTEIHYDHLGSSLRSNLVNKDSDDLTELWNIVFIQYERQPDGNLTSLGNYYVDTGLGLERLVTLLQSKKSNYDTDLFLPLFETIQKVSSIRPYGGKFGSLDNDDVDTSYRILADHSRMLTVALSDGMLPDYCHSLRRVFRKALHSAEKLKPKNSLELLTEVCFSASQTLKEAFPEVEKNWKQVEMILRDEAAVWKDIKSQTHSEWSKLVASNPHLLKLSDCQSLGLIGAYKYIKPFDNSKGSSDENSLPLDVALICYDRFGLPSPLIDELASVKGYSLDIAAYEREIESLKMKQKSRLFSSSLQINESLASSIRCLPETMDSFKFDCIQLPDESYQFPVLNANALAVVVNDRVLNRGEKLASGTEVGLILDKTNFHSTSVGDNDIGTILIHSDSFNGKLSVEKVMNHFGRVLHIGKMQLSDDSRTDFLSVIDNATCSLSIDPERRMSLMRNVTCYHLLSSVFSELISSRIIGFVNKADYLGCKFLIFDNIVDYKGLSAVEDKVKHYIRQGYSISRSVILSKDLIFNSSLVKPDFLNTIQSYSQVVSINTDESAINEISPFSNVATSSDVCDFSIVNFNLTKRNRECTVTCISGNRVKNLHEDSEKLLSSLLSLNNMDDRVDLVNTVERSLNENKIPIKYHCKLKMICDEIKSESKQFQRDDAISKFRISADKMKDQFGFVFYYADKDVKLEKLTKCIPDTPAMVFAYNKGALTARCTTPKLLSISAYEWMREVCAAVGSEIVILQGHPPERACNMKPKKVHISNVPSLVETAERKAFEVYEKLSQNKL